MPWPPVDEVDVPDGCLPCRFCGGYCMEAEGVEDWNDRGFVIRIYSMCDESDDYEKDDIRTEFFPVAEVVQEWNRMQTE